MPGRRGRVGRCGCPADPGRPGLAARLGHTVWFYLAASAALLAGMGWGLLLAIVAAGTADADRVLGLAYVHLNLLGWVVGLAVVGTRGAPRGDVAALEDLLLRVSALVEAHPEIAELDCNPVKVLADGVVVVDARVRVEAATPPFPLAARRR
jgi:ATP-grasp domain